jgi:hypothetical protein
MPEAPITEVEPADATAPEGLMLDVHGLVISAGGDWPEVVEEIGLDFAWFRRPVASPPAVRVTVRRAPPDFDSHGDLRSGFVTPRNVVNQDGETTVVDYFGRAVSVLDGRAPKPQGLWAHCAGGALARSRLWRLWVGRDHERTWETLRELLRS